MVNFYFDQIFRKKSRVKAGVMNQKRYFQNWKNGHFRIFCPIDKFAKIRKIFLIFPSRDGHESGEKAKEIK